MSTNIKIDGVRLSYPKLFTAEEFKQGDGKPRYSARFMVPKGSKAHKDIQAAVDAEAREAYKDKAAKNLAQWAGNNQKMCWQDGDETGLEGDEGYMILSTHKAGKTGRPTVIDRDKSPLAEGDGKPYAGCWVNAGVSIYAQTGENPGIRGSFTVVQFAKDGDAFSPGGVSVNEFESLAAADTDDLA